MINMQKIQDKRESGAFKTVTRSNLNETNFSYSWQLLPRCHDISNLSEKESYP